MTRSERNKEMYPSVFLPIIIPVYERIHMIHALVAERENPVKIV
jgi:hypothetical protein